MNGNDTSGILNICYDSQWHTVCDLDFGDVEARVACKAQGLDEKGKFQLAATCKFSLKSNETITCAESF